MTALVLALVACAGTLGTGYMTLRGIIATSRAKTVTENAAARAAMHAANIEGKDEAMTAVLNVANEWKAYALAQAANLGAEVQRLHAKVERLEQGLDAARTAHEDCRRELVLANARISALGGG